MILRICGLQFSADALYYKFHFCPICQGTAAMEELTSAAALSIRCFGGGCCSTFFKGCPVVPKRVAVARAMPMTFGSWPRKRTWDGCDGHGKRGNFKNIAQAAKCRPRGQRAGLKACDHTLIPREEVIVERHDADWDESFEIGSQYRDDAFCGSPSCRIE